MMPKLIKNASTELRGMGSGGRWNAFDRASVDAWPKVLLTCVQAWGPGLITQRVDHPALELLPFAESNGSA